MGWRVVGRQRDVGAGEREVGILPQAGRNLAGLGGGDMLPPGEQRGILSASHSDGLLQRQRRRRLSPESNAAEHEREQEKQTSESTTVIAPLSKQRPK